jgi:hypothetical protein
MAAMARINQRSSGCSALKMIAANVADDACPDGNELVDGVRT